MKLLIPNLNFEGELAAGQQRNSRHTDQAVRDLAPLMGLLAADGDIVICPEPLLPEEIPACLSHVSFCSGQPEPMAGNGDVVPWGWTEASRRSALHFGMSSTVMPSLLAVRDVNSRRFSGQFDRVLCEDRRLPFGHAAFGTLCRDLSEWRSAVTTLLDSGYARWVAKPQHSHAGRNRLLAHGDDVNREQLGWLQRHLQHPDGVYLEPWVDRISEAGLQFDIARHDCLPKSAPTAVTFLGTTGLLNDAAGRYQGSMLYPEESADRQWLDAVDHGRLICAAAAACGYFGPLGIDCFRYQTPDGVLALRLCNDINARLTMGRLALALRPLLDTDSFGIWCQFSANPFASFLQVMAETLQQPAFDGVKTVVTSPVTVSGQSVRTGTVLFEGKSANQLLKLTEFLRTAAKQ